MKADALTPVDLFGSKVQFEIPPFQRPYVWTEEDQWAPLWLDIKRVASKEIAAGDDAEALGAVGAHFLGAIVINEVSHHAGDLARSTVIDGQQRMTTLQVLLDAAQAAVGELGYEEDAEALEDLILNSGKRFEGTKDRFKLWPSRTDRPAFEAAMEDATEPVSDHRISEAHVFFASEVRRWIVDGADEGEEPIATQDKRAVALSHALQSRLYLVAINLGVSDDDQLIFETLNDRGTPLLAADLIKNWIFQRGEQLKADTEGWANEHWAELDEEWWREEIRQGRLMRSRVDIFLQYWLTMRMKDEIPSESVFRRFREHVEPSMATQESAESLLRAMRRDANTFRSFAQLDPETPAGRFYKRVVESFELAATTPLLLWMLSENHQVPDSEIEVGLSGLESWVVRRTVLRMTMKDVNKLMIAALGILENCPIDETGQALCRYLSDQTADARLWPSDQAMMQALPEIRLYGNVRQGRLRVLLEGIERRMRTEKQEDVGLPSDLQIEHVMPRAWRVHWDETPPLDPEAAAARSKRVDTLGNLTLVTQKLNGSLSNRPWTDQEAEVVAPTGKYAGQGKLSLIHHSLLALNKELAAEHPAGWTEEDIRSRSADLTRRLCEVWPRA